MKILRNIILSRDIIICATIVKETTELPFLVPTFLRRIDWKAGWSPTNFPTKLFWKAKTCGPSSAKMFLSFKYRRGLSPTGELPDLAHIHAYARTRVHTIISRALREVLHPSRRLALAPGILSRSLTRQIFISRTPAARHCAIRVGYSCSD